MTRQMYDSTSAADIPSDAPMVGGYISGPYAWSDADWELFPNATKVRIATLASVDDGDALDVETGDATPEQAPGWVQRRRAATGTDKAVYVDESNWDAAQEQFVIQQVPPPQWWVAAYPGPGPVLYEGSVAHQYVNQPDSGGHYDISVVADHWPGVDPAPSEDDMGIGTAFWNANSQRHIAFVDGSGTLQHQFWDPTQGPQSATGEPVATGQTRLDTQEQDSDGTIHLFTVTAAGKRHESWQSPGGNPPPGPSWNSVDIG